MESWKILLISVLAIAAVVEIAQHVRRHLTRYRRDRIEQFEFNKEGVAKSVRDEQTAPVRADPQPAEPPSPPPRPRVSDEELRGRLRSAENLEDCIDVYNDSPVGSAVEDEAIAHGAELMRLRLSQASTLSNCYSIIDEIDNASLNRDELSAVMTESYKKALTFVTTHLEAKALFDETDNQHVDESTVEEILAKAIALANFKECLDMIDELDSSDYQREIIECVDRALELAETAEDCEDLREKVLDDEDFEDKILTKEVGLLVDVEDCEKVWNDHGVDTHLGELAICRAADLIREHARLRASALKVADSKTVSTEAPG